MTDPYEWEKGFVPGAAGAAAKDKDTNKDAAAEADKVL